MMTCRLEAVLDDVGPPGLAVRAGAVVVAGACVLRLDGSSDGWYYAHCSRFPAGSTLVGEPAIFVWKPSKDLRLRCKGLQTSPNGESARRRAGRCSWALPLAWGLCNRRLSASIMKPSVDVVFL